MHRVLSITIALFSFASSLAAADRVSVSEDMAHSANKFLATLSDAERAKATRSFDDPARMDWHNIPKAERKGLQVREMSMATREQCHNLLKTGLSDVGYQKAELIMSLEANLLEGEKGLNGAPLRDPLRYFLTIFGTPGPEGNWGWSFEGHHFSLNFTISDGEVIDVTPSFWGANPATVHVFVEGGPKVGVRTLADEEQLAFDLLGSLNEAQQKQAILSSEAPKDYRNAGVPTPPQFVREGVAASELNETQLATLKKLLSSYANHLEAPLAKKQLDAISDAGWGNVHFGWSGATTPGKGHYYRIQGPTFVLELVNIQSDPQGNPANHIHSVWRDVTGDFGVAAK